MTITRKMSALEFLEMPDSDGERVELVNGEVVVSPRPSLFHQYTSLMLSYVLVGHIQQGKLGILYPEVDAILDAENVRIPDLLFYSRERMPAPGQKYAHKIPDLCVEILSPSNHRVDRIEKYRLYQAKGVGHYWIVDPDERTIEAFSLRDGTYVLAGAGADDQTVSLPPFLDLEISLSGLWHP